MSFCSLSQTHGWDSSFDTQNTVLGVHDYVLVHVTFGEFECNGVLLLNHVKEIKLLKFPTPFSLVPAAQYI